MFINIAAQLFNYLDFIPIVISSTTAGIILNYLEHVRHNVIFVFMVFLHGFEGESVKKVTLIIIAGSSLLVGCTNKNSSFEDPQFKFVYEESIKCSEKLSKLVIANNEPYTFSFAYYVSSQTVPVINANFTQSEKLAISYFIAPTRDNHVSGSAWRACMSEHGALVSNIQFPER